MQVLKTTSPSDCTASPPRSPISVKPSSSTSATPSANRHLRLVHDPAADHGNAHHAAKVRAGKRRVTPEALKPVGVDHPSRMRVDEDPVVLVADAENLGRPRDAGAIDGLPGKTQTEHDSQDGLEAVKAVGTVELRFPLVPRVIGRDRVYRSVEEALEQRLAIECGAKRWIDRRLR